MVGFGDLGAGEAVRRLFVRRPARRDVGFRRALCYPGLSLAATNGSAIVRFARNYVLPAIFGIDAVQQRLVRRMVGLSDS